MEDAADFQREARRSVIVRALVTAPGGQPVERRVRNLSRSGGCIEQFGELAIGMTVTLHMGTFTALGAQVQWVTDRLAGLQFDETIDLDEARKPRGTGVVAKSGWMADINDAYRR
ncbi:PilZ domain-containing protein [Sphingomonas sp. RP10(2022)]|uniref:PilZ domain-containing protein n=1 Tax=Sphingomonas liriopis TaxID=2949094 RepID=A0A9X2HVH7_9SPHN|nr:PilZ domain-containing protein [Sphingomonas liriopis]MCP3734901.1 PilZ domain-containing protein [Sphingomonas liriopis]